MSRRLELTSPRHVVAALVALPAVATILLLAAIEGYGLLRPDSPLFVTPPSASLAEAIRQDDVESAFAMVMNGHDPNRPIEVNDNRLTGGRTVRVSPLLYAVAARDEKTVRMLLGFGARPELPPDVMAACLADAIGDAETAEVLRRTVPAIAAHECSQRTRDESYPLLAFAVTDRR